MSGLPGEVGRPGHHGDEPVEPGGLPAGERPAALGGRSRDGDRGDDVVRHELGRHPAARQRVTERLLDLPVDRKPACSRCWARWFCGGGCHHENLITTGGLGEPNPVTCEILRHSMDLTLEMWARLSRDGILGGRRSTGSVEETSMNSEAKPFAENDRPACRASCHARDLADADNVNLSGCHGGPPFRAGP